MRRECEHTRKSLGKYLQGHLFKPEQIRIERHLKKCPLCSSELQALKFATETRKLLKDITPPESVVERIKGGVSVLASLKRLLYRPLWIAGIVAAAAGIYFYVVVPIQLHFERERAEVAALSSSEPLSDPAPMSEEPAVLPPQVNSTPASARPKTTDPLIVTMLVSDEKAAMAGINAVMEGHAVLKSMRFTETTREISGRLSRKELLIFFNRIESLGRIRYSSSRLESFPSTEPIPFVMRLKVLPGTPENNRP